MKSLEIGFTALQLSFDYKLSLRRNSRQLHQSNLYGPVTCLWWNWRLHRTGLASSTYKSHSSMKRGSDLSHFCLFIPALVSTTYMGFTCVTTVNERTDFHCSSTDFTCLWNTLKLGLVYDHWLWNSKRSVTNIPSRPRGWHPHRCSDCQQHVLNCFPSSATF